MNSTTLNRSNGSERMRERSGKWLNRFTLSSGVIFFIMGSVKIISAFGKAHILDQTDPITEVSFKHLMLIVGLVELFAFGICLFKTNCALKLNLIAWISTMFFLYRTGLWAIGWHRPCPCLGNVTDALHLSPIFTDFLVRCILAFLMIGSYSFIAFRIFGKKPTNTSNLE
jgi:hypothetical protein